MAERQFPGVVETNEFIFRSFQPFGVPASVWDDGLAELFGTSVLTNMPMPFQELLTQLQMGRKTVSDYPRTEGQSDHAYVVDVLQKALTDYRAAYGEDAALDGSDLIEHDPWGDEEEIEEGELNHVVN